MAMLAAIQKIADQHHVLHQASIEESMACGIGVCMTCVIPLRGEDGVLRMSRSCIDGPVVDGSSVIWDSRGSIPHGTLGEPRG
jgi:dihydroorotate dehydrogenase electron transfer subunit